MTLLTPWTLQTEKTRKKGELLPVYGTTYDDFANFMCTLNGAEGDKLRRSTFLERCLLKYIHNIARNLKSNKTMKKASQEYRK